MMKLNIRKNNDFRVGCVFAIISLLILIFLPNLCAKSKMTIDVKASSSFFPFLVLSLQFLLSIALILCSLNFSEKDNKNKSSCVRVKSSNINYKTLAILVIMLLYLLLITIVGFLFGSAIILIFFLLLFGYKNIIKLLIFSIFIVSILYFISNYVFLINLPKGLFFS